MTDPTFNLQLKVAEWRAKARAGTLTLEENKEAIKILRAGRALISQATGGSKSRTAKPPTKSGDDLLSELEGL
ncbi:MAG: hypothetical protein Q7T59_02495 [Candidatus Woesebacteria bacterium]|nr:hypothetical protein [Candidatus Woesebacteria bacterium]